MKTNFTLGMGALIIAASIFTTSCKDDPANVAYAPPSADNFQNLRNEALESLRQTKDFNAEDGLEFTSAKGAKITIFPNCLVDSKGNEVTGTVQLSITEMYDRGNMLLTNKPVMGRDDKGNLKPLITGGHYNLEVHKGKERLNSGCQFFVSIPASNTGSVDNEMTLWRGNINEDGNLTWDELPQGNGDGEPGMNIEVSEYNIWDDEFGWTNIDRFYDDPRPKTQIKVVVPKVYNQKNAAVYVAIEDQPNALAQLDYFNTKENYFTEHYGFLPIGLNVHAIFVSESNGSILYAIKKVTIAENSAININTEDFKTATKEELINIINGLN